MLSLRVEADDAPLLAAKVEQIRLKCRVPKAILASLFGVNPATYWRWVKGQSVPSKTKLQLVRLVVRALMAAYNSGELPLTMHNKSSSTIKQELRALVYRYSRE